MALAHFEMCFPTAEAGQLAHSDCLIIQSLSAHSESGNRRERNDDDHWNAVTSSQPGKLQIQCART